MTQKYNFLFIVSLILAFAVFSSCKSIKEPEHVETYLDYTNDDVVQNEIHTIRTLLETDCVKALWRACILKNQEIIDECTAQIILQLDYAIENKDYYEAARLTDSIKAAGIELDSKYTQVDYNSLIKEEIPGSVVCKEKLPQTIMDCINATVTVWVDKGLKVENGAGYADIVIGSGFFIDKRGYIITNHHVIDSMVDPKYEGYSRVFVKLPSDMETKIPAKVIGYDSVIDLALLKVEIEPDFVFELGSSSDLGVGDKVSAIGTPIGLEGTLTSGIISAIDRKLTTMGSVLQLDAAVNSGNSGGPLIDENKKVQAIVFAGMLQFQGLNFAIPVEYLKQELPLLYKGGQLSHVWISSYGHTKKIKAVKSGVEVQYVMPGGSAFFSGIKENCLITSVDNQKIESLDQLQFYLMSKSDRTLISVNYTDEEGRECTSPVYLEARPENPLIKIYESDLLGNAFLPIFGMSMIRSSTTNRRAYSVKTVLNGTSADEMGFSENDPVTVQDIKFDTENDYFLAQLYVQRRKKGFIDVSLTMGSYLDSPYYF